MFLGTIDVDDTINEMSTLNFKLNCFAKFSLSIVALPQMNWIIGWFSLIGYLKSEVSDPYSLPLIIDLLMRILYFDSIEDSISKIVGLSDQLIYLMVSLLAMLSCWIIIDR